MDVNNILFRASSMGELMVKGDGSVTEVQLNRISELQTRQLNISGREKPLTDNMRDELEKLLHKKNNPELSETTKKRLVKVYADYFHGRIEEISSKYTEKGNEVENDSITLYSRVTKKFFKKNETRLNNRFVTGLPDLGDQDPIDQSEEIIDIKSAWSLITFLNHKIDKKVKSDYDWQGTTYMGLIPKAKRARIAHCLVNSPAKLILDEKFKLQKQMGFFDPSMADADPSYVEKCQQIERNHIFDLGLFLKHNPGFDLHNDPNEWRWDIPIEQRVHEFLIERNEEKISALYKQCLDCRVWIHKNLVTK